MVVTAPGEGGVGEPREGLVGLQATGIDVDLGGRAVLRGVDLAVAPGELVVVIGPNGAGKSTLARVLAGVLAPGKGSVMLAHTSTHGGASGGGVPSGATMGAGVRQHGGELVDTSRLPPAARARAISYLPQGATLAWPITVERLVGLGRLPHLAPFSRIGAADRAAIDAALARADVLPLRDRVATELSGGERSRALLARALAVGAAVLIADEPLAALDPGHALAVVDLLRARSGARSGGGRGAARTDARRTLRRPAGPARSRPGGGRRAAGGGARRGHAGPGLRRRGVAWGGGRGGTGRAPPADAAGLNIAADGTGPYIAADGACLNIAADGERCDGGRCCSPVPTARR